MSLGVYRKLIRPTVAVVVTTLRTATELSVLLCDVGEMVIALTYRFGSGSCVVLILGCLFIIDILFRHLQNGADDLLYLNLYFGWGVAEPINMILA